MNNGRTVSIPLLLKQIRLCSHRAVFLILFFIILLAQTQAQQGWSQFRGEDHDGIVSQAGIPDVFPENGPELMWTLDVGEGFPEVVAGGNVAYIFSSDSLEGSYEYVSAIQIESGKEIWKIKVDSMWFEPDGWGHGPRATPAIDEDHLYCLSGHGKLSALKLKNGKLAWTVNLPQEFGSVAPRWGFSSSPTLIENSLILETGGTEGRAFTSFDTKTGKVLWSKGIGPTSYNSPAHAQMNGETHIVFANDTMLSAFSPSGEELWSYRMPLKAPMAMPVFMPPNKFFVSSVSRTGSFVIELNENNEAKEILSSTTMQNNWSSSCYLDGYLYGFSKAKLQCVSAESGEMTWGKRGFGKGSLIMVDNKLLALSDQGKIILIEAKPEAYNELGSFQALEGKSWTAPSYANGKLFVRNLSKMSCYKLIK